MDGWSNQVPAEMLWLSCVSPTEILSIDYCLDFSSYCTSYLASPVITHHKRELIVQEKLKEVLFLRR
jgi:hypothetical protein